MAFWKTVDDKASHGEHVCDEPVAVERGHDFPSILINHLEETTFDFPQRLPCDDDVDVAALVAVRLCF